MRNSFRRDYAVCFFLLKSLKITLMMAVNFVKYQKLGIYLHALKNKNPCKTIHEINSVFTKANQRTFSTISLTNVSKTKFIPRNCRCSPVQIATRWQCQNFCTSNNNLRKGDFQNSKDDGSERIKSPSLMDFPQIAWPNPIKSIRNFLLSKLIIGTSFDQDFSLDDVSIGARKAFVVVARLLQAGDLSALTGLLTSEAIQEINKNYKSLTPLQKRAFFVTEDDIYFSFPYQVGIIMNTNDGIQERFVEITFSYHCLLGLPNYPITNFASIMEHKDKVFIANCRFIKEFTKGVESDWTMNIFNIFKPTYYR